MLVGGNMEDASLAVEEIPALLRGSGVRGYPSLSGDSLPVYLLPDVYFQIFLYHKLCECDMDLAPVV